MSEYEARKEKDRIQLQEWMQSFKDKYPSGYILSQHEQNGYHDSYFSERIFIADEMRVESVSTGATAYGCPAYSTLLPWLKDAPQEVKDKYVDFFKANRKKQVAYAISLQAEDYCREVRVGSKIRLIKQKKSKGETYAKGLVGQVFWKGKDNYSQGERYGLQFEDGRKLFVTASESLELVPTHKPSPEKQAQWVQDFTATDGVFTFEDAMRSSYGHFSRGGYEFYSLDFVEEI